MKHQFTGDDVRQHFHGKNRPPLRTIREMADEFSLTIPQLRARLAASEDAPKPVLKRKNADTQNTWYDPAAVRAWWKQQNTEAQRAAEGGPTGAQSWADYKRTP